MENTQDLTIEVINRAEQLWRFKQWLDAKVAEAERLADQALAKHGIQGGSRRAAKARSEAGSGGRP